MPDENLSPESQEEESVGISGEEEESSARRRSGRYSPHSTTTTGTTPPSRKRQPVTPKTEEEEDEEEERAAAAHAGSSATSDSDVDTSADLAAATTPLKQVLVAAIKLSGSISRQHSDRALQIVTDLLVSPFLIFSRKTGGKTRPSFDQHFPSVGMYISCYLGREKRAYAADFDTYGIVSWGGV